MTMTAQNSYNSGKPQIKGRFQPGVSGNPGGVPKSSLDIRKLARSHCEDAIRVLASILNNEKSSDKDRIASAQIILDRGYGKSKDETAVAKEENEIPEDLKNMSDADLARALTARITEGTA